MVLVRRVFELIGLVIVFWSAFFGYCVFFRASFGEKTGICSVRGFGFCGFSLVCSVLLI